MEEMENKRKNGEYKAVRSKSDFADCKKYKNIFRIFCGNQKSR